MALLERIKSALREQQPSASQEKKTESFEPASGGDKVSYDFLCRRFLDDENYISTQGFNGFFYNMIKLLGGEINFDGDNYTMMSNELTSENGKQYVLWYLKTSKPQRGLSGSGEHGRVYISYNSEEGSFKLFGVDTYIFVQENIYGPHTPHNDGKLKDESEPQGDYSWSFAGNTIPSFVSVASGERITLDEPGLIRGQLQVDRKNLKALCAEIYRTYKEAPQEGTEE